MDSGGLEADSLCETLEKSKALLQTSHNLDQHVRTVDVCVSQLPKACSQAVEGILGVLHADLKSSLLLDRGFQTMKVASSWIESITKKSKDQLAARHDRSDHEAPTAFSQSVLCPAFLTALVDTIISLNQNLRVLSNRLKQISKDNELAEGLMEILAQTRKSCISSWETYFQALALYPRRSSKFDIAIVRTTLRLCKTSSEISDLPFTNMSWKTIKQVLSKLKSIPEDLCVEILRYLFSSARKILSKVEQVMLKHEDGNAQTADPSVKATVEKNFKVIRFYLAQIVGLLRIPDCCGVFRKLLVSFESLSTDIYSLTALCRPGKPLALHVVGRIATVLHPYLLKIITDYLSREPSFKITKDDQSQLLKALATPHQSKSSHNVAPTSLRLSYIIGNAESVRLAVRLYRLLSLLRSAKDIDPSAFPMLAKLGISAVFDILLTTNYSLCLLLHPSMQGFIQTMDLSSKAFSSATMVDPVWVAIECMRHFSFRILQVTSIDLRSQLFGILQRHFWKQAAHPNPLCRAVVQMWWSMVLKACPEAVQTSFLEQLFLVVSQGNQAYQSQTESQVQDHAQRYPQDPAQARARYGDQLVSLIPMLSIDSQKSILRRFIAVLQSSKPILMPAASRSLQSLAEFDLPLGSSGADSLAAALKELLGSVMEESKLSRNNIPSKIRTISAISAVLVRGGLHRNLIREVQSAIAKVTTHFAQHNTSESTSIVAACINFCTAVVESLHGPTLSIILEDLNPFLDRSLEVQIEVVQLLSELGRLQDANDDTLNRMTIIFHKLMLSKHPIVQQQALDSFARFSRQTIFESSIPGLIPESYRLQVQTYLKDASQNIARDQANAREDWNRLKSYSPCFSRERQLKSEAERKTEEAFSTIQGAICTLKNVPPHQFTPKTRARMRKRIREHSKDMDQLFQKWKDSEKKIRCDSALKSSAVT